MKLKPEESKLLRRMIDALPVNVREKIDYSLPSAILEAGNPSRSSLIFYYKDDCNEPSQRVVGNEWRMLDEDGEAISILISIDRVGRLMELEFIREGEGRIVSPRWDTLEEVSYE